MTGLTQQAIQQALGREIPEEILIIAKMAVVGMAPDRIAETLGSSKVEVEEILESQDYKDVRLLVGVEHARLSSSKDFTWDSIEATALEGLSKRAGLEKDTDTLLRIAAVANKAQRRMRSEEHTSELQSLMRNSYAVFCLKKKIQNNTTSNIQQNRKENRKKSQTYKL